MILPPKNKKTTKNIFRSLDKRRKIKPVYLLWSGGVLSFFAKYNALCTPESYTIFAPCLFISYFNIYEHFCRPYYSCSIPVVVTNVVRCKKILSPLLCFSLPFGASGHFRVVA